MEPDAPLCLSINSAGGDPVAAFDLYQALRSHQAPVTCLAGDRVHSAALIAYLGGDVRVASAASCFVVHGCACDPIGRPSATALRAGAQFLDNVDKDIELVIAVRAGRYSPFQLRLDMAREVMLDAFQAELRGLVSTVVAR